MKKIALAALASIALLPACAGGDQQLCLDAQAAFDGALELCGDTSSTYDPWYSDATCEAANDDGYDNTEFYTCLVEKYEQADAADVCEDDGMGGTLNEVREFEDESGSGGDGEGCYDLYNNTPT